MHLTPPHRVSLALRRCLQRQAMGLVALALMWLMWPMGSAMADIRLPGLLGDGMVLQQGRPIQLWGWASPGERITATLAGQKATSVTDAKGQWKLALPARKATTPGRALTLTLQGKNRVVLRDILIGEVWLCSGQSNMQWPLTNTTHGKATLARLTRSGGVKGIRLFRVNPQVKRRPTRAIKGRWHRANVGFARWFSAICYYFGERLHAQRRVPVGLIQSAWGGTTIEAWMPYKALTKAPSFAMIIKRQQRWEKFVRPFQKKLRQMQLKRWQKQAQKARKAGKKPPPRPRWRRLRDAWHANSPSALYNGMIYPLHPFGLRGVLWYQGESNVWRAHQYRDLFPLMIERWRTLWGYEFPFLYAQLAPFQYSRKPTAAMSELCEAQLMTLKRSNHTAMAVTNDLGNPRDIHPRRKRAVALRLYKAARAKAYGDDKVVYSGPIYKSHKRRKNKIELSFDHVGGGLVARGGKLTQFTIAGKDRRFVPAKAYIVGDHVLVWSDKVPHPVAVRLAWSDIAVHHLYNLQGLPASPFRTDRWPGITDKRQ